MCGLLGIINRDGSPVDRGKALRLLDVLEHRGTGSLPGPTRRYSPIFTRRRERDFSAA